MWNGEYGVRKAEWRMRNAEAIVLALRLVFFDSELRIGNAE
jgi:hypothetical protein